MVDLHRHRHALGRSSYPPKGLSGAVDPPQVAGAPGELAEAERELVVRGRAAFPGFRLRRLARTRSTQDVVRAAARGGASPGFCVIADEQTAGRGRQGRRWHAPPKSALLLSVLLRPRGPLGVVPLAAGLAVAEALERRCRLTTVLRWPNDVLDPDGAKLAGILAEVEPRAPAGEAPAVVLGVGVNLSVEEFPPGVVATSVHRLVAPQSPPAAPRLAADVLEALAARIDQLGQPDGIPALLAAWRRRAVGLGEPVVALTPRGELRGRAVDVAADGALLLDAGTGPPRRLVAADVHLVRPYAEGVS